MLLTFKNIRNEAGAQNDIFTQASTAALDLAAGYAAASGSEINLKSATIQLGKALNDPIAGMSALTRVGVQFTEEQQNQIAQLVKHNNLMGAQKIILAEVTSQFQGSAEAQATASGRTAVALENLAETVGKVLAPAFEFLLGQLNTLISWLQDKVPAAWDAFTEGVGKAWDAVRPFAEAIGSVLIPLLETAWEAIKDKLLPALERMKPILIVIGAAVVLFGTVVLAQFAAMVIAVSFVVDALLDFVGFIRDKVVEPVVNFLARIVDFVLDKVRPIWDAVRDTAATAWRAVAGFIEVVIGKIETLIGWIQDAIHWLGQLGRGVGEALAGKAIDAGIIEGPTGLQHGGVVARSGLAVVHKGEMFSGVNNEMGFGGINGDIVLNVDGKTLARITRDQLVKLGNRNSGTGL